MREGGRAVAADRPERGGAASSRRSDQVAEYIARVGNVALLTREGEVDLARSIMPNLSGTELISRVRRQSSSQRILCVSGYPVSPTSRTEDGRTQVSFLRKPFSPAKLAARIRTILDELPE